MQGKRKFNKYGNTTSFEYEDKILFLNMLINISKKFLFVVALINLSSSNLLASEIENCYELQTSRELANATLIREMGSELKYKETKMCETEKQYIFSFDGQEEHQRPGYYWTINVDKSSCEVSVEHGI